MEIMIVCPISQELMEPLGPFLPPIIRLEVILIRNLDLWQGRRPKEKIAGLGIVLPKIGLIMGQKVTKN